jgi:hypothetical protein
MKKIVERKYTRDAQVPRSYEDFEMKWSFRCIPVPPSLDDGWVAIDFSKDYKTGWERVRYVEDDEGKSQPYPFPDEGSIPKRPVKYEQLKFDFLDR